MVTDLVVGMFVGAFIALVCLIAGYYIGEKSVDNENVFDGKESNLTKSAYEISEIENNERAKFKIVEDEIAQRKTASNLFRTKKGLLSYKKFVRE